MSARGGEEITAEPRADTLSGVEGPLLPTGRGPEPRLKPRTQIGTEQNATGKLATPAPRARDRAVGRRDRFCLCGAITSDGNFFAANRLIMVNRARIIGNGRTVRFDRSALTRHTIDGAPGRGARVTPIRRWIEEPP